MDYDHLFAYLDTRPLEEKKKCMDKIVELVKRNTSEDTEPFEESTTLKTNMLQPEMSKLLMDKHVWVQQAVWNKFGSREVELTNMTELSIATAPLLTEPKVAQYILTVNQISGSSSGSKVNEISHFAKKSAAGAKMETNFGAVTRDALQMASFASTQSHRRLAPASVSSAQYTPQCSETEQSSDNEGSSRGGSELSEPTVAGRKRKRGPRAWWTSEMTAALVQAVNDHKDTRGWRYVAEQVGKGVSVRQCYTKWNNMKTQQKGQKQTGTKWTEDEIETLQDAVQQQKAHASEGNERISWSLVSQAVGRTAIDCRNKHGILRCKELNKEPFTVAEDDLIRQRVAEWLAQKRGRGLWMALQEEMHRPQDLIHRRAVKLQNGAFYDF